MAIYRQRKSRYYWYSVYVPGSRRRMRGSTGTTDIEKAKAIEATMRLAAGGKTPAGRLIDMIRAITDQQVATPGICRLAETYEGIAETIGATTGARTAQSRRQVLARFAEWARQNYPACQTIGDVGRDCAAAFASSLGGLAPKTRQNIIGELAAAWNVMSRGIELGDNPWPRLAPVRVSSERYKTFTNEEVGRILEAADADSLGEWGLACRIALATGLRYGDVARLRGEDIENGAIVITPSKTKSTSGVTVCLPLPPEVCAMIPACRGFIMPRLAHQQARNSKQPEGHEFARILKAAGITGNGYTFHSFRHTFRTRLARCGISQQIAMALGGWTREATAQRYDHDDHREEYRNAIEAAWRA